MKKVDLKIMVSTTDEFRCCFDRILKVFSDVDITHIEFTIFAVETSVGTIRDVVSYLSKHNALKDISHDCIYTFVFVIDPVPSLVRTLLPLKTYISKVEVSYQTKDVKTLSDVCAGFANKKIPCVIVLQDKMLDEAMNSYNSLKHIGVPLYVCEKIRYNDKFDELFKSWLYDVNGCRIDIFADYASDMLLDYWGNKCKYKSCLTRYFTVDSNGEIYACNFRMNHIGNIFGVDNLKELYSTNSFSKIITDAISSREKCRKNCNYYSRCQGGCCLSAPKSITECEERMIFDTIDNLGEVIRNIVLYEDYRNLNPAVQDIILSSMASNKIFDGRVKI